MNDDCSDFVVCNPFALSVGESVTRRFEMDDRFFEVTPGATGLPTVRDRDVLLYCASWLANAMFDGRDGDLSCHLRFAARDFLKFSKRGHGGAQYGGLKQALDRLAGTRITTNLPSLEGVLPPDGIKECGESFNLICYETEQGSDGCISTINIELPSFVYRCATEWTQVCPIHPDYFLLPPFHRLLYMIVKGTCGTEKPRTASTSELHQLVSRQSRIRDFRKNAQGTLSENSIPEYRIEADVPNDKMTFYRMP
jgi:plasmid replication initiation protein